jgi:Flp pilus assembly secretin CpaC
MAMSKTVAMCGWTVAALLALIAGAVAQEDKDAKPAGVEEAAGPRLRIRFLETRQRGEKTTTAKPCLLMLHTGDKGASVFVGAQVALSTNDKGTPTVLFKNAGVSAQVTARALADGRYRLEATFEESSVLAGKNGEAEPSNGGNPILQEVRGESVLVLREGETVPFASAVDPVTGEVVRVDVDVAVDAAQAVKVAPAPGNKDARLHARFVLNRRRGDKTIASRPYSVVLQVGEEKAARVFSGTKLPVSASYQGQPTVMLKDIGAGVHLGAQRIGDGRYRLDLSVSDGALSAANGSPRVQSFQAESRLYLRAGETVVIASAADPQSGDVVEAELTIEGDR